MKIRRLFSLFFCLVLALSLAAPARAAADDVGDWEVEAKAALLPEHPRAALSRQPDEDHDLPAGAGGH